MALIPSILDIASDMCGTAVGPVLVYRLAALESATSHYGGGFGRVNESLSALAE